MKVKKTKSLEANIPTASMADIAFLLIVFFMISTVFQVDKTSVALPTSHADTRHEVVKESAFVIITKDGTIKASDGVEDSQLVNIEDIQILAASWMQKRPSQPVVIKADGDARFSHVDKVLKHLRDAGVVNLKFLTEQAKSD
ncbi:Biopolymer transporter ExbD [Sulfidibacter corallicola]|uniref:Biopolymer transporter ExbD n=1 Tax=Sulfidibacter corallicola TaxID=2818388 RepID=A0A8A4TTJ1_SULCO|nr:biopolymer transporter ExbD [Sulfidibacter corallicola]QTD53279.1 biopolymer transporter ExbD [Sulfidibacter corallicola]